MGSAEIGQGVCNEWEGLIKSSAGLGQTGQTLLRD